MTREDRTMIKPLRVLGDKFRRKDKARPVSSGYDTPWWVDVLTNWGRPVVAVVVLTMCAPGEHYLAHTAGWSTRLAWGMPFVLTAYAGISAVVATKRPKGSPGKRTAVAGAILSIAVAMAAQPIAHLYQRDLISGYQTQLTIVASCIPALVLGHLLHLAVSPASAAVLNAVLTEDRTEDTDRVHVPSSEDKDTRWVFEDKTYRAGLPVPARTEDTESVPGDILTVRTGQTAGDRAASLIAKAFDVPEDILVSSEDRIPVRPDWMYGTDGVLTAEDTVSSDAYHYTPAPVPAEDKAPVSPRTTTDQLSSRRKLPALIEDIRGQVGDNSDAIKSAVLATPGFEDTKKNTLHTAVRRALAKSA